MYNIKLLYFSLVNKYDHILGKCVLEFALFTALPLMKYQ